MKIYISGKITGLPIEEARQRFAAAESLLLSMNAFEAVFNPMKSGLPETATWNEHMVQDIKTLLECDAIFMMDNWIDSVGAQIEYDIAKRKGMDVWFGLTSDNETKLTYCIANAIQEVTGMAKERYMTQSRKNKYFFPRMIFAYHCSKNGMDATEIGLHIKRERTSVAYLIKQYETEYQHNPAFRETARKVEKVINQTKIII